MRLLLHICCAPYGILVQSEHSSGDRIQSQKEYIDEVCRGYSFASDCQE